MAPYCTIFNEYVVRSTKVVIILTDNHCNKINDDCMRARQIVEK